MSSLLVTVVGPVERRDLSLPADAPVAELLPTLVQLVGDLHNGAEAEPGAWMLSQGTGQSLSYDSSLGTSGILDGSVLYLARVRPAKSKEAPPPPPVVDDHRTPAQRTAELLPQRRNPLERVGRAITAFFTSPGSHSYDDSAVAHTAAEGEHVIVDPELLSGPSPDSLTVRKHSTPLQRVKESWR